ncbi:MAG: DNA-processing protein DprA [Proteobacteria bacterium]|nr:DNA-processing protein DprA [Pseudomonadota bacterium]
MRGQLSDAPAVAIVGARAATRIGMDRAHTIARHCAERGVHVVSGGALGIDGAAHRGALAGRGATTVVLGSGIDIAYPPRHAPLFAEILAHDGALVSLLPPGTAPRPHTFLHRNPLIAALADITIVVEASLASGSLSTAAAAQKLGRIVVAWPGSRGCERLLARGAAVIEHPDDAIAALSGTPRFRPARKLDPSEQAIADAIAAGHTGVDAIALQTGLPVRTVLRALPLLEETEARNS